jgi:iron(III) transport system substrate-binding protein
MLWWLLVGCRVEVGAPEAPTREDAGGEPTGEVWIYTSMYQSVIDQVDPLIRAKHPGLDPKWFQAGSEKVAQRLEAEWSAGGSKACLLMTSDPFWYVELAEEGRLAPYLAPTVLQVDRDLVDPDGLWVNSRTSLMVLAVNGELVPEADRPRAFADLADPRFRDRFSTSDPLASGTMFTTLAFWVADGWGFAEALKKNGLVAAGGNSAVLSRIETGERPVGVVLLENVLAAQRKGSPVVPIYPEDGAIVVPGPIALTSACPNPTAAKAVYDFLLGPEGQEAIAAGDMYAALPSAPPPKGAKPLSEIPTRPWKQGFAERVVADKAALKERWSSLVAGP